MGTEMGTAVVLLLFNACLADTTDYLHTRGVWMKCLLPSETSQPRLASVPTLCRKYSGQLDFHLISDRHNS